jgi:hypothetical protein
LDARNVDFLVAWRFVPFADEQIEFAIAVLRQRRRHVTRIARGDNRQNLTGHGDTHQARSAPQCRAAAQKIFTILRAVYPSKLLRNTAMEVTNEPQYVSATRTWHPSERRDVRRTIDHWLRNTWGTDSIPLLETFDFSPMKGDWGHRFLICGDDAAGCYSGGELVFIGDPVGAWTPEGTARHEYGHHIAANRANPPWRALDWGTKRWASVCKREFRGLKWCAWMIFWRSRR